MGSFYNDASLVMIPSGYKDQKVYCAKPADGSGDLVFSRASSATRVASNGLIEKVRTNLLLQSNGFSTANWVKGFQGSGLAPVVTANAGTAPDGTNTASRVVFNCVGVTSSDRSILNQGVTSANSTPHASSVFIKAFSAGEVGKQVRFVTEFCGAQLIITLTADWQKVVNVGTSTSTSINFLLETRGSVTANTSADVLLAFTQLETGDIATDYIPTTTAAVSVGPVSGLPRLDYLNSTCPKLLLEPQRTNSAVFSEQLNIYTAIQGSVTANASTSPDGYTNADKFVVDNGLEGILQQLIVITAATHTFSAFAKADGLTSVSIQSRDNASAANQASVTFNLSTGVISTSSAAGAFSAVSGTITDYGNGWYRCTTTFTSSISTTTRFRFFTPTGNGTNGLLLYGTQAELTSAYATSYIPTLGASVTRVADVASKTGITSLIGQTEGTLFADLQISANASRALFSIDIGTTTNYIAATTNATSQVRVAVSQAGSATNIITSSALTLGRHKLAIAYKSGDYALYIDGVQAGVSASTLYPVGTLTQFVLNNASYGNLGDGYSQALVFKTRLTNSQLQELTTL
jgi:hypothetical protein